VRMILMREGEFEEREVVPISVLGRTNMNMADEDNVLCGYIFLIPFNYPFLVVLTKSNLVWTFH
jgi:hypothetical protein